MKKLAILLFLALGLSAALAFIPADEALQDLVSKMDRFRADYPQEKIHLHLDKPYYAVGDTIWFKAYVVDAESHQLSALSKIIHVELINDRDSVEKKLLLPLRAGLAWGDFELTADLQEGHYRIRAYTNYMRNFDEAFFFDHLFMVGNAISNDIKATASYQYGTDHGVQQIKTTINYQDMDGRTMIGKPVSYQVQLGADQLMRGKAITDEKGNITFSFASAPRRTSYGQIRTVIALDNQIKFTKNFPIQSTANETDIQFFPEGGTFVNGIRSKVAFKVIASNGLGKNASGYISNSQGEKTVDFRTGHAGMGAFVMRPIPGQSYMATVVFEDGSERKIPLPKAQDNGFVLSADNNDSTQLLVKISASPTIVEKGGEVYLVAQSNSVIKFAAKNKLDNAIFTATIPKSRFPTGIVQLTLFDQQQQPVAERLVFINHNDNLEVKVNGPQSANTGKKVKMMLDVKDHFGKPVTGNFSVSVTDATKMPVDENSELTMLSNLLLTSDLKGYIEKPNYYFVNSNEKKAQELDQLMLTQGWRRFSWKNVIDNKHPDLNYQVEEGISISGRVTRHGKPVTGGKVTLLSAKGGLLALDTLTDNNGRFAFKNLIFLDSTKFVVQARTAENKDVVDIQLDNILPQQVLHHNYRAVAEINIDQALSAYLKNSRLQFAAYRSDWLQKGIQLSEVNIMQRKKKTVKGSSNLATSADVIITGEELENAPTIGLDQFLIGRVAGLVIRDSVAYLMRRMNSDLTKSTPMTLIVDGMRLADPTRLAEINPHDVEGIEVLKGSSSAMYGMLGGGVLIITTKSANGPAARPDFTEGVLTYAPKGYDRVREFYSPNYDQPRKTQTADLRTTVYWNPNVMVKDGRAVFEFFNADGKGPYKITIEGIDINGNLARKTYTYQVN
ncbi:MAG: TonB-dependent receptor plug domain-containing protein [Pedobacter sp.]|nr:TonB-dependent receptor plug domain-containing protein [Pedobacter sp.]MDQ8052976.1 TonB-dependent receptor plug domain-containing protein [Pedobacter sp.]